MARLTYRSAEELDPADRELLARPVHLYRAMVNSPGITRAFLGLANHIRHDSRLDPRLRELAILQVAWTARSAYEWSHHVRIGRQFGVSDADLRAIVAGAPDRLDPAGAEVLRAAEAITLRGDLPDEAVAALRRHLDEAALTELLLIAAFYVGLSRFLTVARIEVEPDYMAELREFPLPAP
ncbi:carboxymuconolactone decarboxylase family protein [Falsiroseomonas sp.]|uniref:carboxymuconolactone decarboxylase family protein n=1 Tax=Falsiroseomonas sp. TaxID=2870721 RepID=UPI0035649657